MTEKTTWVVYRAHKAKGVGVVEIAGVAPTEDEAQLILALAESAPDFTGWPSRHPDAIDAMGAEICPWQITPVVRVYEKGGVVTWHHVHSRSSALRTASERYRVRHPAPVPIASRAIRIWRGTSRWCRCRVYWT